MSQGKYSPNLPNRNEEDFIYNCYGKLPTPCSKDQYDEKTMFPNYDSEGFDRYGYSCFDSNGNYVGIGCGVDRNGYTEFQYLVMTPEQFENI